MASARVDRLGTLGGMPDSPRPSIVVLNGPNLNLLGERQPEIYGHATLADVEGMCREAAERGGHDLDFRQTNHEGVMVDWSYRDGAKYLPSDDEVRKLRPVVG